MTEEESRELTLWRMSVDDRQRAFALQMGSLEQSVSDLQGDVQQSNEWSRANHDRLAVLLDAIQSLESLGKLADKIVRWLKPFLWILGGLGAMWAWGKSAVLYLSGHMPGWVKLP